MIRHADRLREVVRRSQQHAKKVNIVNMAARPDQTPDEWLAAECSNDMTIDYYATLKHNSRTNQMFNLLMRMANHESRLECSCCRDLSDLLCLNIDNDITTREYSRPHIDLQQWLSLREIAQHWDLVSINPAVDVNDLIKNDLPIVEHLAIANPSWTDIDVELYTSFTRAVFERGDLFYEFLNVANKNSNDVLREKIFQMEEWQTRYQLTDDVQIIKESTNMIDDLIQKQSWNILAGYLLTKKCDPNIIKKLANSGMPAGYLSAVFLNLYIVGAYFQDW